MFILFYLKLIQSYTSVWSNIILVNILVNILIVLLVVYILYYYFTVNFSKSYFFVIYEYFWLFVLIILVLLLDLFTLLLDSYTIARSIVVITYILTIFCIVMKNSLFCDTWAFLTVVVYCLYSSTWNLFILILLIDLTSFL